MFYFAKVREDAVIPTKEDGNAGYDIYANFPEDELVIEPLKTKLVPTGIASALSNDLYLQVEERGSTGSKGIKKSAGVVDASYRGEIFVAITNCNNKRLVIAKEGSTWNNAQDAIIYPYKKAIAQLVLHKVYNEIKPQEIKFEALKAIPSTRGDGALGSSGK